MEIKDLEKVLKNAKFQHLTDDTLISYRDEQLDGIKRKQAANHLQLCLLCTRRLVLFQGERAALDDPEDVTADEYALISRVLQEKGPQPSKPGQALADVSVTDRFADYIRQALENLQAYFKKLAPVRGADPGDTEVWRCESKDGLFVTYAVIDQAGGLRLHFSSSDMALEGARLRVKAGLVTQETTLERTFESELHAEVEIPRRKRPRKLTDISIVVI